MWCKKRKLVPIYEKVLNIMHKHQKNITVSASMADPSSSLTVAMRPPEPASKFFMEAPWRTIKLVKKVSLYGYN